VTEDLAVLAGVPRPNAQGFAVFPKDIVERTGVADIGCVIVARGWRALGSLGEQQ
jgi:hypothetical protein